MATQDLMQLLQNNSYPGRGLVLGRSADGKNAVAVYFIMGRSANSRNRVFTAHDGGIITEAADESKMIDPSLIIYAPVRVLGDQITVVTNGDQTDTICDSFENGESFSRALRRRTFEPDAPNFTPRVSGYIKVTGGRMRIRMAILKSDDGNPDAAERFFFEYPQPQPGEGRFLHTYDGDGDPIHRFTCEPRRVAIPIGIGTTIYISEIAHPRVRGILKPAIEVLAGIPSVVYGLFGLLILSPYIRDIFGVGSGTNALNGAINQ